MSEANETGIGGLPEIVARLSEPEKAVFQRIFRVEVSEGALVPPDSMRPWIERYFGSVEATLRQRVLRVTNVVTGQGALFNPLRSQRPHPQDAAAKAAVDRQAEFAPGADDPLADPLADTPADTFGRVEGRFCITAANVAKFDGFHSLVVFNEPHPLRFDREMIRDYFDTGLRWAQAAHAADPSAKYFFFMWNCLWRAGASLAHGHAQVLLGRGAHYPKVEQLRRAAVRYRERHGADYFDDLYRAHASVGCAFEKAGVKVMANLAPLKEHEASLVASQADASLADGVYEVLACLRDRLGVVSFNLALHMPPIAPAEEDWSGFPVIVHIVDRGDPWSRTSDIGAMELYGASIIAGDPLRLARLLKDTLGA